MNKTGGVIGIIAGLFAIGAALVTLLFGGVATALHVDKASTVVGLGWGGVLFAFLTIIFGALAFSKPRLAGWGMIISSILGAILGGTLVALFMALALVGGMLSLFGGRQPLAVELREATAGGATRKDQKSRSWLVLIVVGVVLLVAMGINRQMRTVPSDPIALPGDVVDSKADGDALARAPDSMIESKTFTEWAGIAEDDELTAFAKLSGTYKPTTLQQEARVAELQKSLLNAKGKAVIWDVIVRDVSSEAAGFSVSTKCDALEGKVDTLGLVQKMQPDLAVVLIPRNSDDKRAIQSLQKCTVAKIKGRIESYDTDGKIPLSPAILVAAGPYVASDVLGYPKAAGQTEQPSKIVAETNARVISPPASAASASMDPPAQSQAVVGGSSTKAQSEEARVPELQQPSPEISLREADTELNRVYKALMMTLDKAKQAELKRSEVSWIRAKEKECGTDSGCLKRQTDARIAELMKLNG